MRHLRERLTREGELVARAPSPALRSEDVVIPRHVFDGLEDAALVNLQWEFFPGRDDET